MKRSRFSEEQVIAILKQHESGVSTADLCREHGMSSASFSHLWMSLPLQGFFSPDLTAVPWLQPE